MRTRVEVCVVGGGPAGAVAARLLASWGRSVILLHRRPAAPPLAESLPPSTRKLLALVGVDQQIDDAHLFPNTGNSARWAGRDLHTTSSAAGYHVSRDTWDALLLASAQLAGVRVVDATVRQVDARRPRVFAVDAAGSGLAVDCRYVLDCSGRAGVVARQGFRRRVAGYRTLAITAGWQTPRWPGRERTQTVVESCEDGWSWSVPLSNTARQCTVMVDPRQLARSAVGAAPRRVPGAALQEVYDREWAKTTALRLRLRGARQVTRVWACDASLYDCDRAADGHAILVGDAASFIEPLSSAGVKKAMLSAWRAAVVANTCLKSDTARSIAFDYHNAREREVFLTCARQAAVFFGDAASAHRGDFWTPRAAFGASEGETTDTVGEEMLVADDVVSAFERLRTNRSARLRVSPRVERAAAPTIEGDEVVLREALRLPGFSHPVRFASNVNLPALVSIVSRHDDVESALLAYRSEVNRIAPADVLRGLSLLVARRAILHEGVRP